MSRAPRPGPVAAAAAVLDAELRLLFLTPRGWVLAAAWLLAGGLAFTLALERTGEASLRSAVPELAVALAFLAPLVTMRQIAGEGRAGTLEAVLAAPVRPVAVVLGKWGAALVLGLACVAGTGIWGGVLLAWGDPDLAVLATTGLGVALAWAAFAAVGLFASSLVDEQALAGLLGVLLLAPTWLADRVAAAAPAAAGGVLEWIALGDRLGGFARGVIEPGDVAWFALMGGLGLAGTWWRVGARRGRRGRAGLAVAATVVVVGLAGVRTVEAAGIRWDLSRQAAATLAPATQETLATLEARGIEVVVTAFSSPPEAWARARAVRDLLADLQAVSPGVSVRLLDGGQDPGGALGVRAPGTLVVAGRGRRIVLRPAALGGSGAFVGEAAVRRALQRLLVDTPPTLLFLEGHGERSVGDRGPSALAALGDLLAEQGWGVRSADLLRLAPEGQPPAVPPEVTAVVIAAPRAALTPAEEAAVEGWLARDGALAFFAEPDGVVPDVVEAFGIGVPTGTVGDPASPAGRLVLHPGGSAAGPRDPVVAEGAAPVVAGGRGVQPTVLLREGPVAVALAAEVHGPTAVLDPGRTVRILAVGDADLFSDDLLASSPGNVAFALEAFRWLVGEEAAPASGAREGPQRVAVPQGGLRGLRLGLVGGLPAAVALLGLAIGWVRRRA